MRFRLSWVFVYLDLGVFGLRFLGLRGSSIFRFGRGLRSLFFIFWGLRPSLLGL